jgi:hypothetical protein
MHRSFSFPNLLIPHNVDDLYNIGRIQLIIKEYMYYNLQKSNIKTNNNNIELPNK